MEMEKNKPHCPIIDIDGVIASGKQFDLDITLPEDNRDVIYGVVRNCFKEPVENAVVKLIEIDCKHEKEERKPVSHTFTDKEGEFVFGPLCPDKKYAIQIWVDDVKHIKICAKCHHEGKCLRGTSMDKCECFVDDKCDYRPEHKCDCRPEPKCDCRPEHKCDDKNCNHDGMHC